MFKTSGAELVLASTARQGKIINDKINEFSNRWVGQKDQRPAAHQRDCPKSGKTNKAIAHLKLAVRFVFKGNTDNPGFSQAHAQ